MFACTGNLACTAGAQFHLVLLAIISPALFAAMLLTAADWSAELGMPICPSTQK
jgi:hypothetical protein